MNTDARAALQSIVDMFHQNYRGPARDELRNAISDAEYGLKGIDRHSDPWNPQAIDFSDEDVQTSLQVLCALFEGPLMRGAPSAVIDIIENARSQILYGSISPD